jgi:hypothetical protein
VLAVGFEIEEIVDDVGGGGAEAEAEEGQGCSGDEAGGPGVSEEKRKEDEDVFRPLMEADGLKPGSEGGSSFVEGADGGDAGLAKGGTQGGGGVGDHGLLTVLEEREVRERVADVGEVVAKAGLEGGELVFAGEIELSVGGEDAGENAEVSGDAVGGDGVGGGGEVEGTADGALLLEVLQQFAVVGEMDNIELYRIGKMTFEGRFALNEPARDMDERTRVVARDGEGGIVKGVRLDERSIEVDAERRQGGNVECGGRDRQKCPFLRLNQ